MASGAAEYLHGFWSSKRAGSVNDLPELPEKAFLKEDSSPDRLFYGEPRFVTHIDGHAIGVLTTLYRDLFPASGAVLDLMSSWVSHLPREISFAKVYGLGLNDKELAANSQLSEYLVQDLNEKPQLSLVTQSFDAAAICVSIQYLQQPVAVLREVCRVLKPGAPLVISFSNRCFPTKAVAVWQALPDKEHAQLVSLYLQRAGFTLIETRELVAPGQIQLGQRVDPLWAVIGRAV